MSTNVTRPEKDTDCFTALTDDERDALLDRAGDAIRGRWYIGTDADGRYHIFSLSERSVAIFDNVADTDPETVDLREQPFPDAPDAWARAVVKRRGFWTELRLGYETSEELTR